MPFNYSNTALTYNSTAPSLSNGQSTTLQSDSRGALLTNPGIYNTTPTTDTGFSVGTSSTAILAANTNATKRTFQNQHATQSIYLGFNKTATADQNCLRLGAGATYIEENTTISNCAVNAIGSGAATLLYVQECS